MSRNRFAPDSSHPTVRTRRFAPDGSHGTIGACRRRTAHIDDVFAAPVFVLAALTLVCPPVAIPPVHGEITDFYRPPPCRWCAGNRGWEIAVRAPYDVVAATDGVVTFNGLVARVAYVVVQTDCGLRITYGRLDAPEPFSVGDRVRRGQRLARSRTIFLGVRAGSKRLDPTILWGRPRARLVPPTRLMTSGGR